MSAFDKIIGYKTIKHELIQICDMIKNRSHYSEFGAKLPKGALLCGAPGLGKTLICNAFIEESGLPAFTIRKNMDEGNFIASITETFNKAKENTPCIVFLDDMDKFANEDEKHRDADAYVAVQAGIDEVAGLDVFVLATVNNREKLPESLIRTGRFDRDIDVRCPSEEDAEEIMKYYLSEKKVSADVNLDDLAKMISYSSCAQLETILNEAAISAAYKRKDAIEMSDVVNVVLRMQYNTLEENYSVKDKDEAKRLALHEAGHLVCCEALFPDSVGFASIRPSMRSDLGGFVHRCKETKNKVFHILTALAAKAAVELYYSDHVASGCSYDITQAVRLIYLDLTDNASSGVSMIDLSRKGVGYASEINAYRQESIIYSLLEMYLLKAKDIILKNREFLELTTDELLKNGVLFYSDIKKLKEKVPVVNMSGML